MNSRRHWRASISGAAICATILVFHGGAFAADLTGDPLVDWNPVRQWTATDGRKLKAEIVGLKDDKVSLRLANGKVSSIPLERLVEEDRDFADNWDGLSHFFNLNYRAKSNIANTAEAGIFAGAFAKEGKEHESRHFRFVCDASLSGDLVKDFSRLFEATHAAIVQHPLALAVAEPEGGKFLVRLYAEWEGYFNAGGPPNSAGLYRLDEREILVPLASLGVTSGPRGFRKDNREYNPATLIHETAHALTHQWLDFMPMWFIEGFAEYLAAIPYRDGRLDFNEIETGLHNRLVKKWGNASRFQPADPQELVALSRAQFMNQPQFEPEPIVLKPVESVEFRFTTKNGVKTLVAENVPAAAADDKPAAPKPTTTTTSSRPTMKPVVQVLNRYSSSMLLVHHFVDKGQVVDLRKSLMASLDGYFDRHVYLEDHEEAMEKFQEDVNEQIDAYNKSVGKYRAGVKAYNDAIAKKNAGESVELPEEPGDPELPDPVEVPEILAKPRAPEELSGSGIHASAAKLLSVPDQLVKP